MEMVEKSRPIGASIKSPKITSSSTPKADSGQATSGSESGRVYVNERGEVCYGDKCVTVAINKSLGEIRVNIKRGATCNVEPLVEAMRDTLGKGCRTVYEVESEERKQS
jgi:hypothetical protein